MNYRKILIAVDNGPTAEKVATNGFLLGQQLKAEIALVSVVETTFLMADGGITFNDMAEMMKADIKKSQQMLIDKIFNGYKAWTFIEEGITHEMILKVAAQWDADLVVLGTHGRTGLSHLLMGSVAEMMVRHSIKPLLIIPARPL